MRKNITLSVVTLAIVLSAIAILWRQSQSVSATISQADTAILSVSDIMSLTDTRLLPATAIEDRSTVFANVRDQ